MGNFVYLSHRYDDVYIDAKPKVQHQFHLEDDYGFDHGKITVEHEDDVEFSPELLFVLASAAAESDMMFVAREKGYLYVNGEGYDLDPALIDAIEKRYEPQLDPVPDEISA
ncbi:hypothetical protein JJB09_25605 [Rhizobium sp. KVB221]|uniref:Uncharacterized protein n=1 Tax=Rhizobium setariae TaxID=2801340 RepID=A0A936YUM0_9HYPH|nr:hypothetical protein [Rhizobium setariae]MBL0375392.1 hypothetical protein [Rhizobium setariae]